MAPYIVHIVSYAVTSTPNYCGVCPVLSSRCLFIRHIMHYLVHYNYFVACYIVWSKETVEIQASGSHELPKWLVCNCFCWEKRHITLEYMQKKNISTVEKRNTIFHFSEDVNV